MSINIILIEDPKIISKDYKVMNLKKEKTKKKDNTLK